MRNLSLIFLGVLFLTGCIEPYQFRIENDEPTLVVEGYISDVSFSETLDYPSDGRFFTVQLRLTSDVTNVNDEPVLYASVTLVDDTGNSWSYTELPYDPGTFILYDTDFEAVEGASYQLQIYLSDGNYYESQWEKLPSNAPDAIGSVSFEESEKQVYKQVAGEEKLEIIKGITVKMNLPENTSGEPYYYRWEYDPMWLYIASLASSGDPFYKCWVKSDLYLNSYNIQEDNTGGYPKDLFFIETMANERLFENFSLLVIQQVLSNDYYFFWKEMKDQAEGSGVFNDPPYNLKSNFISSSGEKVSGYFGVVKENAVRWYFNVGDLSYNVPNNLRADCMVVRPGGLGPAPDCLNCMAYPFGDPINQKPVWWPE